MDDDAGELFASASLPTLGGVVAVVVTKELTVRGGVLGVAGALVELLCKPVKLIEGVRGEEVGPELEVVGDTPTKLIGIVVVDAGELLTVVGEVLPLNGVMVPAVKEVAPLVGVCTLATTVGVLSV